MTDDCAPVSTIISTHMPLAPTTQGTTHILVTVGGGANSCCAKGKGGDVDDARERETDPGKPPFMGVGTGRPCTIAGGAEDGRCGGCGCCCHGRREEVVERRRASASSRSCNARAMAASFSVSSKDMVFKKVYEVKVWFDSFVIALP